MNSPVENEIAARFGVLPNFFRLTSRDPQIAGNLWGFAQFAYLDNPLPSLFKERLFVYLSRFCDVRYCIARHVGFLVGLGHPAGNYLDRIFEPLQRLHGSQTPGTGLGLALCRTIVARHGGRIWVESEGADHGAIFRFTLSAAEAALSVAQ